jgi:hypothetical protein
MCEQCADLSVDLWEEKKKNYFAVCPYANEGQVDDSVGDGHHTCEEGKCSHGRAEKDDEPTNPADATQNEGERTSLANGRGTEDPMAERNETDGREG